MKRKSKIIITSILSALVLTLGIGVGINQYEEIKNQRAETKKIEAHNKSMEELIEETNMLEEGSSPEIKIELNDEQKAILDEMDKELQKTLEEIEIKLNSSNSK